MEHGRHTKISPTRKRAKAKRPRKWIAGAIRKPGALTKQATAAGMTPMGFAEEHKASPGVTGKRARLALTLRKLGRKRRKRRAA